MAVVKNLMVRAGADFSSIVTQSKKASTSMQKMGTSISKASSVITKAMGALGIAVSVAALVSAAKEAANAYKDQYEAEMKLTNVMQNRMAATNAEIQAIKDLCSVQQQLGVIGDEVQLSGLQQLAMYTSQTESLKTLLPAMNDMIAKQYGLSATQDNASTIAAAFGKAMQGNTTSLVKLGIVLSDAEKKVLQYGSEAEKAAVLSKAVESSVGGMNESLANTPLGRIQQLKNVLGDIKEQFGQAVVTIAATFVPLLNVVANGLAKIAAWANAAAQAIANVFGKKMTTTAVSAGSGVSDAYEEIADSATNAGNAAKKASKNILGFDELNRLSDNSSSSSSSGSTSTSSSAGTGISNITYETEEAAESLTWLEKKLSSLQSWITGVDFSPLKSSFEELKKASEEFLAALGTDWGTLFTDVIQPIIQFLVEKVFPLVIRGLAKVISWLTIAYKYVGIAISWIREKVQWLADNLPKIWETIKQNAISAWENIKTNVTEKVEEIRSRVEEKIESIKQSVIDGWTTIKESTANLWGMIKGKVSSAWNNMLAKVNGTKQTIEDKIEEFKQNLSEKWESIKQTVITVWEAIKEAIVLPIADARVAVQGVVDGIVNGLSSAWVTLRENTAGVFVGIYNTICGIIDAAWGYVSGIIENIRSAFATVSDGVQSAFEFGDGGMWSGGYASGGFPNAGQLFVARESGPEMVGTIGGSTAVANNDQIVAAVSRGVFEAVSAAMSNGSNDVRVYLDGSEMTNIITRNQRRNAYTMGY